MTRACLELPVHSTAPEENMPDSPTSKGKNLNKDDIEEVEVKPEDVTNNNNLQPLLIPRPASQLLSRPQQLFQPFPPVFQQPPRLGGFPGWMYRGLQTPLAPHLPPGYPIGRGHELMRRLCTMNPAFAQSIIEDYIRPQVRDGDVVLEIECGANTALMYLSRLCQGSKGPCIWFQESWITPNEFQYISGRETAKDWKRSIRHCGKSMKLLLTKGILTTHPPICDCDGCRISSPLPQPEDPQMSHPTSSNTEMLDNAIITKDPSPSEEEDRSEHSNSPHKLTSSIIGSLLTQRPGQVNSSPSLTSAAAAALWARHSQHLKNASNIAEDHSGHPITNGNNEQDHHHLHHPEHDQKSNADLVMDNRRNSSAAFKQMEQMMGRNYSDFMRSLAAKYNQNTNKDLAPNGSSPFVLPGHAFPLAALAASGVSIPVNKSKQTADLPPVPASFPGFPFFRPPQHLLLDQMTQTQHAILSMMRNAQQQQLQQQQQKDLKRKKEAADALDLTSSSPSPKRSRSESTSLCNLVSPCSHEAKEVKLWSVEDVCQFVSSVELCQPFVEQFREQDIDGSTLVLLKEDHLVSTMKMSLGSVLKFKAALAKKIGSCPICLHCVHCHNEMTSSSSSNGSTKSLTPPNENSAQQPSTSL